MLYIIACSFAASVAIVVFCRSHQAFNSSNKGLLTSYSNILFYTVDATPMLVKYTKTKQMSILKNMMVMCQILWNCLTVCHVLVVNIHLQCRYLGVRTGAVEVSLLLACGAMRPDTSKAVSWSPIGTWSDTTSQKNGDITPLKWLHNKTLQHP
jgi:hypothetical protein